MKILATLLLTTALAVPARHHQTADRYDLKENDSFQKTLAFSKGPEERTVKIDNIYGSIEVSGDSGADLRISGQRTLMADTKVDLEKARKEVRLDISEHDNQAELIVDGPFRDGNGKINWENRGYIVKYDLKLLVPERVNLLIETINDGDIVIRNLSGRLKIRNVNGHIDLDKIAGSVYAHTINGRIAATFANDPVGKCDFKTINGDIRAHFSPALSADIAVKTFNGQILSDYPVSYLPGKPAEGKREHGLYVYHGNRSQNIRIGKGGIEMAMETLNGDIVIARKKQ
jgi:hypothetical protein